MDTAALLATSAQIAVTVAGFTGVVTVFESRPLRDWSEVDKLRLLNLLIGAALPLAFSLFGLVLLSADLPLVLVSTWCSAVMFPLQGAWQILSLRALRRIPKSDLLRQGWSPPLYAGISECVNENETPGCLN